MILTQQQRVSIWWIVLLTSTTGVSTLIENCSSTALTFTLRKFTADPLLITLIGSINVACNFLVAPYVSWKSDRIWTKWGRRKPFIVSGYALLVLALLAIPFAPTLSVLIGLVLVWQFAVDVGYTGVWTPLLYDVVPSEQRGRAVVVKRVMTVVALVFFNLVLIRHFDDRHSIRVGSLQLSITGEQILYAVVSLFVLLALANVAFNVREIRPKQMLPAERFRPLPFLREVFAQRQFLIIYLLLFAAVLAGLGLGPFMPLLITEQFGYSKGAYGWMETAISVGELAICIPLALLLVDRLDRFRIFQSCMYLCAAGNLAFWLYIQSCTAGSPPGTWQIVGFSLLTRTTAALGGMSLEPYVYDLAPRDKLGTINSGFLVVRGILIVAVTNGSGLWVKYYSQWSGAAATNYGSAVLYLVVTGLIGCALCHYFARLRQTGQVIEYGRLEPGTGRQRMVAAQAGELKQ